MADSPIGWWTRRREPERNKSAFAQVSNRLPVDVNIQSAPNVNVPYTEFWNVGKDSAHAWSHIWRYEALAINEWNSVQGWPFLPGMKANPTSLVTPYSNGWANPIPSRSNITMPPQTSLGMLTAVQPQLNVTAPYLKLV